MSNSLKCPHCNEGYLQASGLESSFTDKKYRCDSCDKLVFTKTPAGKAAQLAPLVIAGGILMRIIKEVYDNLDDVV